MPGLQIDPVLLSFGEQVLGQASDALLVTLSNSGEVSLEIEGIEVATGDVADFSVEASACINGLAVGESCTVEVAFTPGAEGPRSAVMQISSPAPGSPFDVLLLGVGVPELPEDDVIFKDRFRFLVDPQIGQM
ncbi:MAG: choice-of-anchor D domain-containing protein [Wenzhouxiangella sp.]